METEKKRVAAGFWTVTSGASPVPFETRSPRRLFELEATARQESAATAVTTTSFYVLGSGYTAWERFDHNRIELVGDKPRYKPGDTARIMIQSPWERATALVTTEREGIRSHRQFALTSTQQSVDIPVTENDFPNLFVSVLLIKGRTVVAAAPTEGPTGGPYAIEDPSDPASRVRLGYVDLQVEVAAGGLPWGDGESRGIPAGDRREGEGSGCGCRGSPCRVKSRSGRWTTGLVATGYRTGMVGSVYVHKGNTIQQHRQRQRIVSRRVLTPKGDAEGAAGDVDGGASQGLPRAGVLDWLGPDECQW